MLPSVCAGSPCPHGGPGSPVPTDTAFKSLEIILLYSYWQDNNTGILDNVRISEHQILEYEYIEYEYQ